MERIKALLEARGDNRSNEEVRRAAQATINEVVSAIFADLPNVNIMGAQGYTPYFNDGDICEWGLNACVDWCGIGDLYYSPVGEDDPNPEYNPLFTRDINNLPGWKEREALPEYANLQDAARLLHTLSDEFNIVDEENGTWWLFIREPNSEKGFRIETGTFEHD